MERLQKRIAASGIASRRKAEELILQGRVKVNGVVVTQLGTTVENSDIIMVDDKPLEKEELEYWLLNKPAKYVCTNDDEHGRNKVTDLIDTDRRIFPVGRLDYDTTGLLILTNDGKFANMLTHPRYHVEKLYHVTVNGVLSQNDLNKLARGVTLDDGIKTLPAKVKMVNYDYATDKCTINLTITEGRNRQVRRMIEALGFDVRKLHRAAIGPITDKDLPVGTYRRLKPHELKQLRELSQ
ncbi:MAG: rRNA pseudouridine synthase [Erysipelotrichaceae bacterium]|nr:rRNA pseudouridine synthase [Erysipelotrichaceae bacterium]